jgi:hypothetical protein
MLRLRSNVDTSDVGIRDVEIYNHPVWAAWNVTRSYRDISQQVVAYDLTAVFVSEEYPKGLESKCNWSQKGMQFNVVCDPDTFSVEPQTDGSKYSLNRRAYAHERKN